MTDTPKPSLRQALQKKPFTLLIVPILNLGLIIIFWQSQITHYATSTEGVLIMWLVAGLVFGLIQLSLLAGAWKQAIHTPDRDIETLWLLGIQIATLCVMTAYSMYVTSGLLQIGIYPNQPLDIAIMVIFGATLLTVGWRYG